MDPAARVCPFCGELPGAGMFCAACGRSLAGVERLPTRPQWETGGAAADAAEEVDDRPLAERCAEATAAFLQAMGAAGHPGAEELPSSSRSMLRRAPKLRGWIVIPVDRDDEVKPRRYRPGVVLTVDGDFHQLDSELRGWGQRDFPQYLHTTGPEPIPVPEDARLIAGLSALEHEHLSGG
jgi:hypothetical protein